MLDREKVIKELKEIYDEAYDRWVHCQYTQDKLVTLISDDIPDALALLREQEPVEPIERNGFYYCGACRYALMSRNQRFCSDCGKAVKWDA